MPLLAETFSGKSGMSCRGFLIVICSLLCEMYFLKRAQSWEALSVDLRCC